MSDIEIERIGKAYPGVAVPALSDVTLNVPAGELVAVLGPSGSGKSTLLKVLAGIEVPDRGTVRLGGRDLTGVPAHRRGVVLMFQKAHLFPYLSVVDNVAFGLRVRGMRARTARTEAERLLDLVELGGMGRRRPSQLSGGQQQRVALARALVTRPRVLLLDEPLSSLDPAVRRTLQGTVRRIQRELGVTTVLVTHDRGEAMAMADRIAVLDAGRLLVHDTPQAVHERPPTRRAAELVGVGTFLSGRVRGSLLIGEQGELEVPRAAGAGHDGPATYAIRPEHVTLAEGAGRDTLTGRVVEVTFRGEYTEVIVLAGPTDCHATQRPLRARHGGAPPELGDRAHVRLPCRHLFPVTDGEGEGEGESTRGPMD